MHCARDLISGPLAASSHRQSFLLKESPVIGLLHWYARRWPEVSRSLVEGAVG